MYKTLEKELWNENLLRIKPAVKNIFYKGNIDLLLGSEPKLAVVGTRKITDYGSGVIEKWMSKIVDSGVVIVSGFMYGVDQKAHDECMKNGGKTIAVLGWGIDWKVADIDIEMYEKILEKSGLILSEYDGDSKPELWKFPQRNRIVAGMSDAVLVVEGAEKSGSMITAKLTKQFDKLLLSVPGPVTSRVAEGTNNLIKNGFAKMVTSAEDVLEEMGLGVGQMRLGWSSEKENDPILEILENEPRTIDELARVLRLPVSEILVRVSELTLLGVVEERNGKYFRQ